MVLGDFIIKTKAFGAFSDKATAARSKNAGSSRRNSGNAHFFPQALESSNPFISFHCKTLNVRSVPPIGYAAA